MTASADAGTADAGAAVAFADVQHVLTLVAEALAAGTLALAPLDGGAEPAFDGETVHLPDEIDWFASARHNRGAFRALVVRRASAVAFGSFDVEPSWADRLPHPTLTRRLFEAVEALRLDRAVRRQYPGAVADLDRVDARALAARPAPSFDLEDALVDAVERRALGDTADAGPLAPLVSIAASVEAAGATVHDSVDAAMALVALLRPARPVPIEPAAVVQVEPLESTEELFEPWIEESTQPAGWILEQLDGEATPSDDDLAAGAAEFRGELRADETYRSGPSAGGAVPDADASGTAIDPGDGADEPDDGVPAAADSPWRTARAALAAAHAADRVILYDEWDYTNARYLRSWCRLHEYRLRGDDFGFVTDVRRRHAVLASQVRRRFSFLRPEAWLRVHRTPDGDELEIDAAIEALVDRRAGYTTDERLYMRRDRARREIATAFLVDLSASTGSPIVDPNAPPPTFHPDLVDYPYLSPGDVDDRPVEPARRAIDIAKESLALMSDAVHVLGDRHAVYGFSGMGRDKVEFYVAKDFDDAPSPRTWAALAAMEPRRYTRMGPAIRHATAKLHGEAVRTKLLIVVSDGYPQDSDYGPTPGDKEYGLQDTARALQEAERAGVSTYCVTIDPAGNDYLRRMCPPQRYSVIEDVHSLPGELAKLYRALTTF